ncbi:galectin-6-like [Uloborus diversus]|uniref:galectin-6-like n=1 Tax=Uloborus diversus TaxID=327109 RepID=UPI0024097047|nr:galectin-6-like [Uloborus diversus]
MAEGKVSALVAPIISAHGLHYRNPRFPVNIKLPDNLECGTKIYVHGASNPDASRFSLNLKNAEKDANIYFHFNPRFDEGVVVRNSRLDESWGDEEREGDYPFVAGESFLLAVTAGVDGYEVEVNGAPFITYNHREGMPLCDVTHLTMGGDVTVYGIHIPLASMPIPLVLRVPKNTYLGDTLKIEGDVPDGADRFVINLQCGTDEGADIMYHFNPRFGDDVIVCNNRCADSWGDEERLESVPMKPGEHFSLSIVAGKDGYLPVVNGNPLPVFTHRLDMSAACSICIDGDVVIKDLSVDCPPVRLPPQVPDLNLEELEDKTIQVFYPTNPVTVALPSGFGPGKMTYVSGKIDGEPTRIKVNLQCGDAEDSEVALHFNPRWDSDEGTVYVLNSLDDGAWGDEIREPNHIAPGSNIEMHIVCKEDGYDVLVDGDVVASFPHRLDAGRVTHLVVDGCIAISRIMAV